MILEGTDLDTGIEILEEELSTNPLNVNARQLLGLGYMKRDENGFVGMHRISKDLHKGVYHCEIVIASVPVEQSVQMRLYLALGYEHLGKHEEAVEMLLEAEEYVDGNNDFYYTLARHLDALGRIDDAIAAYQKSIDILPTAIAYGRICSLKKYTVGDPEFEVMLAKEAEEEAKDDYIMTMHMRFALAKAYDDIKEYDKSFHYLTLANQAMLRKSLAKTGLSDKAAVLHNARTKLAMNKDIFDVKGFGNPEPFMGKGPIFIVGLPRTGSTLIETILSSHSQVTAGGEDSAFGKVAGSVVAHMSPDVADSDALRKTFRDLGEEYIADMRLGLKCNTSHFTDKMLENFWSLGWVRMTVPGARIINAVRNPMDTCLSTYKCPLESYLGVVFSELETCAEYYKIWTEMMAFWHEVLPARSIMDVHYEDMVEDQEGTTRKVLEFVGLPFEPAVLTFHENPLTVVTASVAQVRKPMYKTSVRKWKRYEAHLGPLLEIFGDMVDHGPDDDRAATEADRTEL